MSSTDRQNRTLLAEDWKRIYQTFTNADFQSYDFDNLRRVMISYLRENYPEDFNDYIESSEYLALIDLIAFLGQNLSFRVDLNARENFIDTAERRESILRLARLLSYNPKRNQAANGILKIESISTTEGIVDTNNVNLAGQTVLWNDPSNQNWFEQFVKILNNAMQENVLFGSPNKIENTDGIPTEQYRIRSAVAGVPAFGFNKDVQGNDIRFEIVSADIAEGNIVEESPLPGRQFGILYRNDGQGPGSSNTGFFVKFVQGLLDQGQFSITTPVNNQTISIDAPNINNQDIWLYDLNDNGSVNNLWTQVDSTEGNNVIYNSVSRNQRKIYAVQTREQDRVNLLFADGVFGDLPKGNFRVYYRTSANTSLKVNPSTMVNITFDLPYISKNNEAHTLTITCELKYTVDNSSPSETNESIRRNAPSTYYTQNRMITAEDYNVAPLSVSQEIVKTRAVNRLSSGISRYFDLNDATGKYSATNLFGNDGVIYREETNTQTGFSFVSRSDIENVVYSVIEPILKNYKTQNFYFEKFPKLLVRDLDATWNSVSTDLNRETGFLSDPAGTKFQVGGSTDNNLRLILVDSLLKFEAPEGQHFMTNDDNKLMEGEPDHPGAVSYIFVKVVRIFNNGTENTSDELGAIHLNDPVPTGAILTEVRPKIVGSLTSDVRQQVINQTFAKQRFGLRYDKDLLQWRLIEDSDLSIGTDFSTGKTGDTTRQNLDSSWILLFETDGIDYTVTSRGIKYIFESDKEIKFYIDENQRVFDVKSGLTRKDTINVLSINQQPDSVQPFTVNFNWEIKEAFRNENGYVSTKKIVLGFADSDSDGIIDDPILFEEIVQPETNSLEKVIFLKQVENSDEFEFVGNPQIIKLNSASDVGPVVDISDGQIFYFASDDVFQSYDAKNGKFITVNNYRAFIGRDNLKFHYVHNADETTRIDPSASNIIDIYLLTRTYDQQIRAYLKGNIASMPLPPSSDELDLNFGRQIESIKSISDEVIYHPARYRILFGDKASPDLQASFKIVKNPERVLNDNDVKTRVANAINQFFALENWEFGDTFYFSELSAYVFNQLAPDITTLLIIPKQSTKNFGSLQEIKSESDEVFIADVSVSNCEIIDEITANKLRFPESTITLSTPDTSNVGIQSNDLNANTVANISIANSSTSTTGGSTDGSPTPTPNPGPGGYNY